MRGRVIAAMWGCIAGMNFALALYQPSPLRWVLVAIDLIVCGFYVAAPTEARA